MGQRVRGTGRRVRVPGVLLLSWLLLALAASTASAAAWSDESDMVGSNSGRDTFVFDPGQGSYIDRQALLQPPLAGYYAARGFDANFRTWAPVRHIAIGAAAPWAGCNNDPRPNPCPVGDLHYRPVTNALANGTITTIEWNGAYIALACGNFTEGGGAGPMPRIAGVKYEDLNANGQRDAGEPGLAGWTMRLTYEGNAVATTTTGAGGSYAFDLNANGLPIGAGSYQVEEVQQPNWFASEAPGAVSVPLGAATTTYGGNDFGNYRLATISGHKFDDDDVDGLWGGGELGLDGWTIQLSNGDEQATAGGGAYAFSVRPGTYTAQELLQAGWRQTSPGGAGAHTYTVTSGEVVSGVDFGNVCLGEVAVGPVDDSIGQPLTGVELRIEEVSVPGILDNDPSLPRTTTGTPRFGDLLPGSYRIVAFVPDGVFTTDPDVVVVDGRFAIVKQVTVTACGTTELPLHFFTGSAGKVTGGVKIGLDHDGFATSGFEFMTRPSGPRGTLQYNDHLTGLKLHTSTVEGIDVAGENAVVWGRVTVDGTPTRFLLRLRDAGEPGSADGYELMLETGYTAGDDGPIVAGNVQIHG